MAAASGLGDLFSQDRLRQMMLAHEAYHHLALCSLGRVSDRCRLPWLKLGPFVWRRSVPVLDEIAAHAFVREWCGLAQSPALLDFLTIYRTEERFEALVRRARHLVS
jgi:hypothetical protein